MIPIPIALEGQRRWLLARLIGNGLCQSAITLAYATLVEQTFRNLIQAESMGLTRPLLLGGVGLLVTILLRSRLLIWERTDIERMGQSFARDIRIALYDRLSTLSPRGMQIRSRGGVMLRFVGDITALRQWVSLGLSRLTVTLAMILGVIAALAIMNWVLALNISLVLAVGLCQALHMGQQFRLKAKESRRRMSRLAANINEKIACMAVVQVFGQSKRERRRIVRQSYALEAIRVERAQLAGQLRGSTESTAALCIVVLLIAGAVELVFGRATPSTIVAAMSVVGFLTSPLRDLSRVQEYWHDSRVALQKLQEFLENPSVIQDLPDAKPLVRGAGRLSFESVGVDGILTGISAIAEPGQVIAIIGPNGAGKSTLMSLAARLLEPDTGRIRLDDQDLACHQLDSLRQRIAMVGPDLPLLRGSLRRNLLYRSPKAPEAEIQRVWSQCEIEQLLDELPEGENTRIAEQGQGLSAGQRQRVAMARALLGNPQVLLLDEADANLDRQAARDLDRIVERYAGTVLMISHRLERLVTADVIWYLEDGQLKAQGSLAQLLAAGGPAAAFLQGGVDSAVLDTLETLEQRQR